jgi:hypothetical protein
MMSLFDEWLSRKLARRACTIRQSRTVEEEFTRAYSARNDFARIALTGEPSEEFEYRCEVRWPASAGLEGYDRWVIDGLLDELLATGLGPAVIKVRFTLREIGWHEVYSSPNAFYQAARGAARKVVESNTNYP